VIRTAAADTADRSDQRPAGVVRAGRLHERGQVDAAQRPDPSQVLADDLLFATLDPTSRRLELPSGKLVILTDTVGFIQKLPTELSRLSRRPSRRCARLTCSVSWSTPRTRMRSSSS